MARWKTTKTELGQLTPNSTLVTPEGGWIGGFLRPASQELADRRAVVYRIQGERAELVYDIESAWVVALTVAQNGELLGVVARPGPVFFLLRESRLEPIPADSLTSLAAVNGTLWVLGAGNLLRNEGGGWEALDRPIDSSRDRLVVDSGRLLIVGQGIAATADGGRTWNEYPCDGGLVGAVTGSVVALYDDEGATLAAMDSERQLESLVRVDQPCRPYQVIQRGGELECLAVPRGHLQGQGILHYASSKQKWSHLTVPSRSEAGAASLGRDGRGLAVDVRGQLLVLES